MWLQISADSWSAAIVTHVAKDSVKIDVDGKVVSVLCKNWIFFSHFQMFDHEFRGDGLRTNKNNKNDPTAVADKDELLEPSTVIVQKK